MLGKILSSDDLVNQEKQSAGRKSATNKSLRKE